MKKHSARVAPLSACNSPVLTLTKVEGNAWRGGGDLRLRGVARSPRPAQGAASAPGAPCSAAACGGGTWQLPGAPGCCGPGGLRRVLRPPRLPPARPRHICPVGGRGSPLRSPVPPTHALVSPGSEPPSPGYPEVSLGLVEAGEAPRRRPPRAEPPRPTSHAAGGGTGEPSRREKSRGTPRGRRGAPLLRAGRQRPGEGGRGFPVPSDTAVMPRSGGDLAFGCGGGGAKGPISVLNFSSGKVERQRRPGWPGEGKRGTVRDRGEEADTPVPDSHSKLTDQFERWAWGGPRTAARSGVLCVQLRAPCPP